MYVLDGQDKGLFLCALAPRHLWYPNMVLRELYLMPNLCIYTCIHDYRIWEWEINDIGRKKKSHAHDNMKIIGYYIQAHVTMQDLGISVLNCFHNPYIPFSHTKIYILLVPRVYSIELKLYHGKTYQRQTNT